MAGSPVPVLHREGHLTTEDGLRLFEQSWSPERPRAAVVLVHGFGEHSGRHEEAAGHLACHGYAVQALDLRGHGRSQGVRCFVRSFAELVSDLRSAVGRARATWPERRMFLLGHSLGGLVASLFSLEGGEGVSGVMLSAPAVRLGDDYSRPKILASLAVGRLLPRLPMVRFRSSSISSDPAVVADYQEDELVFHRRTPARTASEIVRAIRRVQAEADGFSLPVLIMHGGRDQVADIEGSREFYERIRSPDKTLRIYDGFWHEIMHEPDRASVLTEIVQWLDARSEMEEAT